MSNFFSRLKKFRIGSSSSEENKTGPSGKQGKTVDQRNKSYEDVREAAERSVKRWTNNPHPPLEDKVLAKNIPAVTIELDVKPDREDLIRRREVEILKGEEEILNRDLVKVVTLLTQMEKRHAEMMADEDQRMAEMIARFEEYQNRMVQKLGSLDKTQADLRSELSSYELEMAQVKIDYTDEVRKREEDQKQLEEVEGTLNELKEVIPQQLEMFEGERRKLEEGIKARRESDLKEINRFRQARNILEMRLKECLVLRKAMDASLAKHGVR